MYMDQNRILPWLFYLLLSQQTSPASSPELVAVDEGKMAAMVVLLHQSRYCNANHY